MRYVLSVLLVCVFFQSPWTQAQSIPPLQENSAPPYLLRIERARYLESVCVLLKAGGSYHLERHTPQKVRVFEGTATVEDLRNIVRIVSGDLLFHLEQKQIPDLMLKSDDERVMLEIHRPGLWQQLMFPDSASREPFRDALNPLLQWLDAANKRKMREFSEEVGRTNCLPPMKPEFSQRSPSPPTKPATSIATPVDVASPVLPDFTLQMFDDRVVNYRKEASCLLVTEPGAYHFVKQSKGPEKKGMNNIVLDGTLAPADFDSLRAILNNPALVDYPEEDQPGEIIFVGDSYFTRVFIPRGGKVQKIAAWKSYRIVNQILSRAVEDHGTKLLVPLREWLKAHIDESAATPTSTPSNPRCSPGG